MKSIRTRRGALALAAAVVVAMAGGIAYAAIPDADGTYHACMLKHVGTIRIIDPDRQRCSTYLEVELSFAKQGPQGDPGPAGPAGPPGEDGVDGADGDPFSGTFRSPNGDYSLSVTDAGIVLTGGGSQIELSGSGIEIRSDNDLELSSAGGVEVESGGATTLQSGGSLSLRGPFVRLNSLAGCPAAARAGDPVSGFATPAGIVTGAVLTGAPTVCVG